MPEPLLERLIQAAKQELARALGELCREVGAAESSILLPKDDTELVFFASTNATLVRPETPHVPMHASFSGIAYRTGQMIAVADAASQGPHFKAVDDLLHYKTREFAAIPLADRKVLGVLSLVNRTASGKGGSHPFSVAELRRAQAFASEVARSLELLPGIAGIAAGENEYVRALGAELVADLTLLSDAERRVAHALTTALIQNRAG